VELIYDPNIISYQKLLDIFFNIHDPTTLNRQGYDIGSQYRSAVFYHNKQQKHLAKASIKKLHDSGKFKNKIVTKISPAAKFYRAEEYHQQYLEKQGLSSCSI